MTPSGGDKHNIYDVGANMISWTPVTSIMLAFHDIGFSR